MSKSDAKLDLRMHPKPDAAIVKSIDDLLIAFNEKHMATERKTMAITAYNGDEFMGGAFYRLYGSTAVLDYLAVIEKRRGQGIGLSLLKAVEKQIADQGGRHITVESMSYQAPDFYRQQGYDEIACIPNYYDRHPRYVLRKTLKEKSA